MLTVKLSLISVLSLALVAFSANSADYPAILVLKEHVQLTGSQVNVTDVIERHGIRKTDLSKLKKIVIAKSPLSGYSKKLSRKYISKLVKNHSSGNFSKFSITGSNDVTIARKSKLINASEYIKRAEKHLYQRLSQQYQNVVLQVVGSNKDVLVPDAEIDISIAEDKSTHIKKRMRVMLEVKSQGEFYTRLPVWFKVAANIQAYKLNHDLIEGDDISRNDVSVILVDATKYKAKQLPELSELEKAIASQALNKEEIVTADLITLKQDVTKGKKVNVIVKVGNVTLHVKAIAKQSGKTGEIVELYNIKNKEIFKGIVVNENYVRSL